MNPLKYYRIFDGEPCPCGSGMKYSLCCKKREDSFQRDNKRPVEVQAAEMLKKSQYKCCLHPDKSRCVKHIKEAHALQNNKIISLLSENGHVYMLNDKKPPLIIPTEKGEIETLTLLDKVGVNRATTATCFCDIHDDEVFAAIEKGAPAFDKGNDEHKFLYAYKAFIFEYYKKLVEQKAFQRMIKAKPSVLKSRMMVAYYRDISLTMREMDTVKDTLHSAVNYGAFDGFQPGLAAHDQLTEGQHKVGFERQRVFVLGIVQVDVQRIQVVVTGGRELDDLPMQQLYQRRILALRVTYQHMIVGFQQHTDHFPLAGE